MHAQAKSLLQLLIDLEGRPPHLLTDIGDILGKALGLSSVLYLLLSVPVYVYISEPLLLEAPPFTSCHLPSFAKLSAAQFPNN